MLAVLLEEHNSILMVYLERHSSSINCKVSQTKCPKDLVIHTWHIDEISNPSEIINIARYIYRMKYWIK